MTNAVPCLDPETIAAYVDRRLDPAERARVEEHLADCEECRTLLSETALFLGADAAAKPVPAPVFRSARRTWAWSAAAAAAAVLALTPVLLRQMRATPESALRDLDRALDGKRYIEARLSGFEYGEYVAPKRGPRDSELPPAVLGAAGHVQDLASKTETPEDLAALGASQLAIGRFDDAIQNLEDAALLAPKNARIQSDLAAAYLTRFRASDPDDYAEDPAKAVEAAATALALDSKSREAAFNYALALEVLPLRGEAQRAWEAYLALDPSSGWAVEARGRIEELRRPLPPPPPSPAAKLDELESDVFPAWGRAVLASDHAAAETALSRARTLAAEIEALDGDVLALDTLSAIEAAPPTRQAALARAHVLVGEGRRAYLVGRFADADRAFADADDILRDGRSPYSAWVLMRRSTSTYQVGDSLGSRTLLDEGTRGFDRPSPTLMSRVHRMRGLLCIRSGDLMGALAEYRSGLRYLGEAAASDDATSLRFLLAEIHDLLGQRGAAWRHLTKGLREVASMQATNQRLSRLLESAIYSARQGYPRTALSVLEAFQRDPGRPSPRLAIEASAHRARTLARLGETSAARAELERCETRIGTAITEAPARLRAEVDAAKGEILAASWPAEAAAASSRALDFFRRDGANWRLATAHLWRARSHIRRGDLAQADQDLSDGLGIIETQRAPLETEEQRVMFFALAGDLLTERLEVAEARAPNSVTTFLLAEETKARTLRESLRRSTPLTIEAVQERIPRGTILTSYAILDDRLLVWKLTSRTVEAWSEPIARGDLVAMIAACLRDVRRGADPERGLASLYDILVRRALRGEDAARLVVVPDGAIHAVPFAALLDRTSNRYLIQDTSVVKSPSAVLYATVAPGRSAGQQPLLVIAAAAAPEEGLPALPLSGDEARRIASEVHGSVLLSGPGATRAAFLDHALRSEVIHFSGHAISSDASPFLSRLLLGASSSESGAGSLLARDIARSQFPATRLVVLGACSTGRGRALAGEGAVNLAWPFLAAGVPAVIASLWDVEDAPTRTLLVRLHSSIAGGTPPELALRSAQTSMIQAEDAASRRPSSWAAFEIFLTSSAAGG
jgi:CHAT domain-containing protein